MVQIRFVREFFHEYPFIHKIRSFASGSEKIVIAPTPDGLNNIKKTHVVTFVAFLRWNFTLTYFHELFFRPWEKKKMQAQKSNTLTLATWKPWHDHVNILARRGNSNLSFQCIYCNTTYVGSKSRLVSHLAGSKGGIGKCPMATPKAEKWPKK